VTEQRDPTRGLYVISVVSELTGIEPHTLRLYENRELIHPARTSGGVRRYSDRDIQRLRRIADLASTGLNLAGVKRVLELEEETHQLRDDLHKAQQVLRQTRQDDRHGVRPDRPGRSPDIGG
jgi:MerR family transcriptional regulator/heat shock protein HspR